MSLTIYSEGKKKKYRRIIIAITRRPYPSFLQFFTDSAESKFKFLQDGCSRRCVWMHGAR